MSGWMEPWVHETREWQPFSLSRLFHFFRVHASMKESDLIADTNPINLWKSEQTRSLPKYVFKDSSTYLEI